MAHKFLVTSRTLIVSYSQLPHNEALYVQSPIISRLRFNPTLVRFNEASKGASNNRVNVSIPHWFDSTEGLNGAFAR